MSSDGSGSVVTRDTESSSLSDAGGGSQEVKPGLSLSVSALSLGPLLDTRNDVSGRRGILIIAGFQLVGVG